MLKVELISYTPEPEKTITAAAKLCYSSADIDEIRENINCENTARFVEMLSNIGHESPMEHVSFTFGIQGVSRAFLAQLTRHRIASYSVKSQRYVNENMFEYVIPPEIENIPQAKSEFIKAMEEDQKHYENITSILKEKHIKTFMDKGIEETKANNMAEKKAIEDARFVLPNACETKIICTFNARSLKNFFAHRCCNRAQWEIRQVAIEMYKIVLHIAPNLFKNSGPSCVNGKCPEGKMCCGKAESVREFFKCLGENIYER